MAGFYMYPELTPNRVLGSNGTENRVKGIWHRHTHTSFLVSREIRPEPDGAGVTPEAARMTAWMG
jgi:hypothetical protein